MPTTPARAPTIQTAQCLVQHSLRGWSKRFSTRNTARPHGSSSTFLILFDQIGPIGGNLTLVNPPTTAEYGLLGNITSITTTAASSGNTVTVASTVGLVVGQPVMGTNIPANTSIASNDDQWHDLHAQSHSGNADSERHNAHVKRRTEHLCAGQQRRWQIVDGRLPRGTQRAAKIHRRDEIVNVVFLATDDHQNRINELLYSPTGQTGDQSTYVKVPYCLEIVCGPLGATGPDLISNHSFSLVKKLADSIANAESAAGLEPIGLAGYPGLRNVTRLGDPNADTLRQPADFYSPDTFNYNVLDVSADGKTLTVTSYGINSTVQNGFVEYDPVNNPERALFSFQIRRGGGD